MKKKDIVTMTFQMDKFIYGMLKKEAKKHDSSIGETIRFALDCYYCDELDKAEEKEAKKYARKNVSKRCNDKDKKKKGDTNGTKKAKLQSKQLQEERVGSTR
jgi:hypothetical protein